MNILSARQDNESAWAYMRSFLTTTEEPNRLSVLLFPDLITWIHKVSTDTEKVWNTLEVP